MLAIFLAVCNAGFYSKSSGVVELDSKNFQKEVIDSDQLWLVEFYAPWCGHCKALQPAWEKVAKALKGIVKVGAVDADADRSLGGQYGVKGFPTLKFFGTNKKSPQDYQGGRDEKSIVNFVLNEVKKTVDSRLQGKGGSQKGNKGSKGKGSGKAGSEGDVVVLTDSNFDDTGKTNY